MYNRARFLSNGANMVVIGQKVVLFGQSGCIRTKVIVFRARWLYLGNNGCISGES